MSINEKIMNSICISYCVMGMVYFFCEVLPLLMSGIIRDFVPSEDFSWDEHAYDVGAGD